MSRDLRRGRMLLAAVAAVLTILGSTQGAAAATTWQITRTPSSSQAGAQTTYRVTFSNLGGPSGDADLGCVRITIPATFSGVSAQIAGVPAGTTWLTSLSGSTTVTIRASNGGSRLDPGSGDTVSTDIVASTLGLGTLAWTANAFESQDCQKSFGDPAVLTILIAPAPTPVPTPTPAPVPTPTPAATPAPTPQATPVPTARPTAAPTATPTDDPTLEPTPDATATTVPSLDPSPSPTDGPTESPSIDATPAPTSSSGGAGPTTGGGSTSAGGGTIPNAGSAGGGADPTGAPGAVIAMPGVDGQAARAAGVVAVDGMLSLAFGDVDWMVPGLVLTVPGLLIVIVVVVQVAGGLIWVPVARRRLGRVDTQRRRVMPRGGGRV